MTKVAVGLDNLVGTVTELKGIVAKLQESIVSKYVTREEFQARRDEQEANFKPVRAIAFGLLTLLVGSVVVAMVKSVLK